jgi:hypothetical protein
MRRQSATGGACPAWTGRALRLDPRALPVRYQVADGQDGPARTHQVFLDRSRVVLRRTVAERMAMTVSVPTSAYEGVAVRLFPAGEGEGFTAAVVLLHREEALSVPLHVAADIDELAAAWQAWGRSLGLPLLAIDEDGTARPVSGPVELLGGQPAPRRRHSHFASRRPRFLARRKPGAPGAPAVVHGEREIIAPE